jgi:hypothetical protein
MATPSADMSAGLALNDSFVYSQRTDIIKTYNVEIKE